MVGAEERVEAALFRRLREVPDLRIRRAVMGFEQDPQPLQRTAFDVVSLAAARTGPFPADVLSADSAEAGSVSGK